MGTRSRGLLMSLLAAAAALVPAASAVAAPNGGIGGTTANRPVLATISAGNLILEPTSRGYVGTLKAAVRWDGPGTETLSVVISEPVAGAWQGMNNGEGCVWNTVVEGRRTSSCIVVSLQHGEIRDITQSFRVLTATRPFAMSAVKADIWAAQGERTVSKVKHYSTTFRGTNGSLSNPQPYVQDQVSDASLSLGSTTLSMVKQSDGTFRGRLPVTVTWNGDAAHWGVNMDAALPDGWIVWDTDPEIGYPCAGGCLVPGPNGPVLMQGETVSFGLIIYAPKGTAAGSYGPITTHIGAFWTEGELGDVSPADNNAVFTATV